MHNTDELRNKYAGVLETVETDDLWSMILDTGAGGVPSGLFTLYLLTCTLVKF